MSVYLPGIDGGDIWDLPNPNLYFAEELFSNSTANVHACIPQALATIVGIKTLTIGYTKDYELAEKIARATGAKELLIETSPEGEKLMLNAREQRTWRRRGWRLEGRTARKMLRADSVEENSMGGIEDEKKSEVQNEYTSDEHSEDGRLKASMLFESEGEDHIDGDDDDGDDEEGKEEQEQEEEP